MHEHRTTLTLLALGGAFAILAVAPVLPIWFDGALGAACGGAPETLWRLWSNSVDSNGVGFPAAAPNEPLAAPIVAVGFHLLFSVLGNAFTAWNSLIFLGILSLTVGVIALGKRLAPNAPPLAYIALVLAVVGSASWAPLITAAGVGMLPMMLVPGALALLHAWLEPQASRWVGFAASCLFLFTMLGHWMATVFVIGMTIPMAIVMTRHWEGILARNRCLLTLCPSALVGVAHIYMTAPHVQGIQVPAASMAPAWVTQTAGALVLPATAAVALPSLGILLLALAGAAARPKDTAGWLLAATWGILLAAGTTPESSVTVLPATHMMSTLPALTYVDSWWAIAPLVSIPLGVSALRGVEALHRVQREKLAMGVLLLALVDQTIPATHAESRSLTPNLGAETIAALSNLQPGGVLQLPVELDQCEVPSIHRMWQPIHGRPVSTEGPRGRNGGTQVSYLSRLLMKRNLDDLPKRPKQEPLDADAFLCAKADLKTLMQFGFAAILLDNQTGEYEKAADILRQAVGLPLSDENGVLLWAIEDDPSGITPEPCSLPLLDGEA